MNKLTLCLLLLLVSCGQKSRMPDGYLESCYGGDFRKNLSGEKPIYLATLAIDESQWGKLTQLLTNLSVKQGVRLFNDTRRTEALQMISISLCSSSGLYMNADKRIWTGVPELAASLPLTVTVYGYRNPEQWRDFAKSLDSVLRAEWPAALNSAPQIETKLMNSIL